MQNKLKRPSMGQDSQDRLSAEPGPVMWSILCCSVNLSLRHVPVDQRPEEIKEALVWYRQSYRKVCLRSSRGWANMAMLQSIFANYYEFMRGYRRPVR